MTNHSTRLLNVILITSTALGVIPVTAPHALAQASASTQTPLVTAENNRQLTSQPTERDSHKNIELGSDSNAPSTQTQQSEAVSTPVDPATSTTSTVSPAEIDTIVVTGSHIRGTVAAGAALDVYDRQTIDQSGYATVHDFLQTIPQNFQGGAEQRTLFLAHYYLRTHSADLLSTCAV